MIKNCYLSKTLFLLSKTQVRHQKICLENSKDRRIDVFQKTIWLLKELVKWTNKQPG